MFVCLGYGHTIARFFHWIRLEHIMGIGYIIVKVGLLLTLEVSRHSFVLDLLDIDLQDRN